MKFSTSRNSFIPLAFQVGFNLYNGCNAFSEVKSGRIRARNWNIGEVAIFNYYIELSCYIILIINNFT